jgi:hypothetical protein
MLGFLAEIDYTVITVVIDKLEHLTRYVRWRQDPYHYCLEVLVERYVMWLEEHRTVGDVLAEARGGTPDRRLEKSFAWLYDHGTFHVGPETVQKRLTSKHLKLKPKSANVTGLQMADLIAHPSSLYVRWLYNAGDAPARFGGEIVEILESGKYRRSRHSQPKLKGYGVKWLP